MQLWQIWLDVPRILWAVRPTSFEAGIVAQDLARAGKGDAFVLEPLAGKVVERFEVAKEAAAGRKASAA